MEIRGLIHHFIAPSYRLVVLDWSCYFSGDFTITICIGNLQSINKLERHALPVCGLERHHHSPGLQSIKIIRPRLHCLLVKGVSVLMKKSV